MGSHLSSLALAMRTCRALGQQLRSNVSLTDENSDEQVCVWIFLQSNPFPSFILLIDESTRRYRIANKQTMQLRQKYNFTSIISMLPDINCGNLGRAPSVHQYMRVQNAGLFPCNYKFITYIQIIACKGSFFKKKMKNIFWGKVCNTYAIHSSISQWEVVEAIIPSLNNYHEIRLACQYTVRLE